MTKLAGTETERNILTAFAGESQARNRYTFFASRAKNEGYEQVAAVFLETADNEKEHAKRLFKFLEGGEVGISADFPAGVIGETAANLEAAAGGEHFEHTTMYPAYAAKAEEEGFTVVASVMRAIAVAEKGHEERFRALKANIEQGRVFKREQPQRWRCRNCGYIHEGPEAPQSCPACAHPQAFFELEATNY